MIQVSADTGRALDNTLKTAFGLLLVLALAACASSTTAGLREREAGQLALYRAHAGAEVDSIPYHARSGQWTPLGEDALVLWTSPGRAYLLELDNCSGLDFARAVSFSHNTGRIHARFDSVTPHEGGRTMAIPCRIERILPIDVPAYRKARRAQRAQASSGT